MQQSPCTITETGDTKKANEKNHCMNMIALNPWLYVALPFKWALFKQILFLAYQTERFLHVKTNSILETQKALFRCRTLTVKIGR